MLIDEPEDATRVVVELTRDLELQRDHAVRPEPLEVTVHRDARGPRVLFAINPSTERLEGEIDVPAPTTVRDVATGELLRGEQRIAITLAPLSCRMLVVVTEERAS